MLGMDGDGGMVRHVLHSNCVDTEHEFRLQCMELTTITLQDEFQSFLKRPEHQPMMEALQRKQIIRGIKAQEIHNAKEFRAKVASQNAVLLTTQCCPVGRYAESAP